MWTRFASSIASWVWQLELSLRDLKETGSVMICHECGGHGPQTKTVAQPAGSVHCTSTAQRGECKGRKKRRIREAQLIYSVCRIDHCGVSFYDAVNVVRISNSIAGRCRCVQ